MDRNDRTATVERTTNVFQAGQRVPRADVRVNPSRLLPKNDHEAPAAMTTEGVFPHVVRLSTIGESGDTHEKVLNLGVGLS